MRLPLASLVLDPRLKMSLPPPIPGPAPLVQGCVVTVFRFFVGNSFPAIFPHCLLYMLLL